MDLANLLDAQSVGDITYPVENRTKRSLCRIVVCLTAVSIRCHNAKAKGVWVRMTARRTYWHSQLHHHSSIYIPTQHNCYSVCQELSASRIKITTARRG
jgi:intein-encoded DNA endonuclease-like protein